MIPAKTQSSRLVLLAGFAVYAIFVRIAFGAQGDLSSYFTFFAALALSIAVILSLVLKASQDIRGLIEERRQPPQRFWLYRRMSRMQRYGFVVGLPLFLTALDLLTSNRAAYYNPTATLVLNFSAMLGLGLPSCVYERFKGVVDNMLKKVDSDQDGSATSLAAMTMFACAAGGSSAYHAVTALVALGAYLIFAALALLVRGLFLFRLLPLLVSIVIAGIVAPMTTTISGFVAYCAKIFGQRQHFDITASDGQGGFRSLGTIGLSSSSMSAVVVGLGVPVSFFPPGTVSSYELGLTMFTVLFVALTFATPVWFAHKIIASSKRNSLNRLRDQYDAVLPRLDPARKEGFPSDQVKLLQMVYLESLFDRVLKVSEWPSDYTLLGGAANAAIPVVVDLVGRRLGLF